MNGWSALILLLAFLMVPVPYVAACPIQKQAATISAHNDIYTVTLSTEPEKVQVAKPFSAKIVVCRKDNEKFDGRLRLDAKMPEHGHGMNYLPVVRKLEDAIYHAVGLIFHMPGKWQFIIELEERDNFEKLKLDYVLK